MFYYKEQNGVKVLVCRALEKWAEHAFCTRVGGVSRESHVATMNFSSAKEDSATVRRNFEILAEAYRLPFDRITLTRQIHSDLVLAVEGEAAVGTGLHADYPCDGYDGLITDLPGTPLGVFTADCTPILMADKRTGAVAAVHAGWRGGAQDIAGVAIQKMGVLYGTRPKDLIAAIGPCIARDCYEVGEDMKQAFGCMEDLFEAKGNGKYWFDLVGANRRRLQQAGVEEIYSADICTHCEAELYYSHRRQGDKRGTMVSVISKKEG